MDTNGDTAEYVICTIDGTRVRAKLLAVTDQSRPLAVPDWLLRLLVPAGGPMHGWSLVPVHQTAADDRPPLLCLARMMTAASRTPLDPRQARLKTERLRLARLNKESDYVRVEAVNTLGGSEPEHYIVTFLCRGIIGIDEQHRPVYGERHQVEIVCDDDFPSDVPRLRWITPIWHPNIQHTNPKGVCVNKPEWLGGMGLDDLCRLMFEMVQYKNYHATFAPPYPLDLEVAKWVTEYAEPQGIVNKKKKIYVDDKPFTRPTVTSFIRVHTPPERPAPRIRVVMSTDSPQAPKHERIKVTSTTAPAADDVRAHAQRIKVIKSKNE
jgi:ubiquitin-protein ligase